VAVIVTIFKSSSLILAMVSFREVVSILLDKENNRNEALNAQAFAKHSNEVAKHMARAKKAKQTIGLKMKKVDKVVNLTAKAYLDEGGGMKKKAAKKAKQKRAMAAFDAMKEFEESSGEEGEKNVD
jgi:hypothetical protein